MSKNKNQRIYSDNPATLKRIADDFAFIGRQFKLELNNGVLTVFALPPRRKKKSKSENETRNKHAESAARRH